MVRWSPDGRFLAVVNSDDCTLQVFRFNGNSSPTLVDVSASTGNLSYPMALSWSPDGRFIAVGVDGLQVEGKELLIFSFDGASKPRRVVSLDGASYYAESVAWSPDGSYLFVSGSTTSFLSYSHILKFDGRSGVTRIGSDIIYSTVAQGTSWSPDGRFAALCVRPANDLLCVYRFNGVSTPMLVDSGVSITQIVNARTTWSPDGRFIAIYHSTSTLLEIYAFDGEHKPVMVGSVFVPDGGFGNDIQWSPDGTVIAISFNSNLYIYRCNYIYTGQPAQSFTNGLLFGDKAKGSSFNANVQVLDGATVTVKGMVSDDAA
jgi:Tol biopolymer transport system component